MKLSLFDEGVVALEGYYRVRSIIRESSHNFRTKIAVIHKKWWGNAISRNDHEIRSFPPNDATLTIYDRSGFSLLDQRDNALEGYCTKFDPLSAIALTIRGLKLQ